MQLQIEGLQEMQSLLEDFAPNVARNLARSVTLDIAKQIMTDAKQNVPVDTGILKRSLKAVRRRSSPNNPKASVVARAVKTRRNGNVTTQSANHWVFVEYGTRKMNARPFIKPASDRMKARMPQVMREAFGRKFEEMLARRNSRRR